MSKDNFDITKSDAQATPVKPISPEQFDLNKYAEYEQTLNERCKTFYHFSILSFSPASSETT